MLGMIHLHNGIVRATAKNGEKVQAMNLSSDKAKLKSNRGQRPIFMIVTRAGCICIKAIFCWTMWFAFLKLIFTFCSFLSSSYLHESRVDLTRSPLLSFRSRRTTEFSGRRTSSDPLEWLVMPVLWALPIVLQLWNMFERTSCALHGCLKRSVHLQKSCNRPK